jgi:hypothetical protein
MEFDEARYKGSGADAHLEKPFDTQRLRQLVQGLVKKTQTQPLSEFLTFPNLPDFEEAKIQPLAPPPSTPPVPTLGREEIETPFFPPLPKVPPQDMFAMPAKPSPGPGAGHTGSWSMESFEQPENPMLTDEFIAVDLPSEPPRPPSKKKVALVEEPNEDQADWVQKSLANYKLDPSKTATSNPKINYTVPEEKIDPDAFISNTWSGATTRGQAQSPPPPIQTRPTAQPTPNDEDLFELDLGDQKRPAADSFSPGLNEKQLEAIIRAQSKEMIEKVIWQVLPEIATRIIERELERILTERKKP